MKTARITAAALLSCAFAAHAAPLFSDDFEADGALLNQTVFVGGWTVSDGTVDVVNGFFGPGKIVDLDGSTGNAGVFSKMLSLSGGVEYTATFALAGSQRGSSETVTVDFGTASAVYTLASSDAFGIRSLAFTPGASGSFALSFSNAGGDNVGILLDNVAVNAALVPEPATAALAAAGLLLLAAQARRRR